MPPNEVKPYDKIKRVLDLGVAAVGLALTAPVQLTTAGLVLFAHGRPILFRQPRPGRNGRVFELVKFRTMLIPDGSKQSDADRLTPLGRILRSTSLDELPSLWNVLKGDMSLVGPRPLLVHYLQLYTPEQARRHEVRPGITGLAQVAGRNSVSWVERLKLDVEYVDRRSFSLDVLVLLGTFRIVFSRRGVSEEGQATMRQFSEGTQVTPSVE